MAFEAGVTKPKQLQSRLANKELQKLTIYQIKNVIKSLKEKDHYGTISAGNLLNILNAKSRVPDDEDKGFVSDFVYDDSGEETKFRVAFTTKRVSTVIFRTFFQTGLERPTLRPNVSFIEEFHSKMSYLKFSYKILFIKTILNYNIYCVRSFHCMILLKNVLFDSFYSKNM